MFEKTIVFKITDMFKVTSPRGRAEIISNRKTYGISFCIDGQITYKHKNQTFISDKSHAVILPKGQTYSLRGDKSGSFPVINFECEKPLTDTIISLPISNSTAFIKDYEKMKSLSLFGGGDAEIMSIFYHILHRLSNQTAPCQTIMPGVKYLEKNFQNPTLNNKELAKQCNISEVYFRRLFIKHYNMTPKQYIIDIRINKAKELLSEGALKIGAVAKQCGFSEQYHFCRTFKEKTGQTPSEYMNQNIISGI